VGGAGRGERRALAGAVKRLSAVFVNGMGLSGMRRWKGRWKEEGLGRAGEGREGQRRARGAGWAGLGGARANARRVGALPGLTAEGLSEGGTVGE
jgi:hypothetical protein